MTKQQWFVLIGTVISGAASAWIHAGGPNPSVAGIPVITTVLGILALFMTPPTGTAS